MDNIYIKPVLINPVLINIAKFLKKNISLTKQDFDLNNNYPVNINLNLEENSQLLFKLDLEDLSLNNTINFNININLYSGASLNAFIFFNLKNINLNFNINLIEENSSCDLKILSLSGTNNICSINTTQNHIGQNTRSSVKTKRVLGSLSNGNYTGKILINNSANNSDATQQDVVLIVGDNIKNSSIPALEINNNQVKCKHSFAVHKIDSQQIFYLKSRGLDINQVKKVALNAFMEDIFNNNSLELDTIKNRVSSILHNNFLE